MLASQNEGPCFLKSARLLLHLITLRSAIKDTLTLSVAELNRSTHFSIQEPVVQNHAKSMVLLGGQDLIAMIEIIKNNIKLVNREHIWAGCKMSGGWIKLGKVPCLKGKYFGKLV